MGLTFFQDSGFWIWPKPYFEEGMIPEKMFFKKGTILIDSYLTEQADRGDENFTVIHEVFHHILHSEYFLNNDITIYSYESLREHPDPKSGLQNRSELEICEYQANYCTSCFLMPKEPVTDMFKKLTASENISNLQDTSVSEMAKKFSVTKKAMQLRLQMLGLQY